MGCCNCKTSGQIIKIIQPMIPTDENDLQLSRSELFLDMAPNNSEIGSDSMISEKRSSNNKLDFVLHKQTCIHEDYLLGKNLGLGGLGSVRIAQHRPTKQDRAIKSINKLSISTDMRLKSQFFTEVDILRQIDHPNIVRLYEFYEDSQSYHLVMELLKGGDLFTYLLKENQINEQTSAVFFKQILSAVSYCHSKGIVHRDLKPDHLLLESNNDKASLKIIDFGTSAFFQPSKRLTRKYGTTYYIAPEVLTHSYSEKCDVWSCGVILYLLLSGTPPFNGLSESEIIAKIMRGQYSFSAPIWGKISADAKDLISKMLTFNQDLRISAKSALSHPWILRFSQVYVLPNPDAQPLFNNLKKFHSHEKLQQAVLTFIATQLLSKEETRELSEKFREIDKNGDGKIGRDELLAEYSKKLSRLQAQEEVERIMKEVDIDNSGFIDYTEFLIASMKKEKLLSRRNLENSFKVFDRDNSGTITILELKTFLGNDTVGSKAAWDGLMGETDMNDDGELDLQEFKALIFKIFN